MKMTNHKKNALNKFVVLCLWCFLLQGIEVSTAQVKNNAVKFTNPIGNGADPWIVHHNGYYYVCQSNGDINSKGISVSKSAKLSQLGKPVTVWTAPDEGWNR